MVKAAADPQKRLGKVAAYLRLPQDDPDHKGNTVLSIPWADVISETISIS